MNRHLTAKAIWRYLYLIVGLTFVASNAMAQGEVWFDNTVLQGLGRDVLVRDVDGTPLKNAPGTDSLRGQLLYGAVPDSLTPHPMLVRFRPSDTTLPGTWRGIDASDDLTRRLPIGGVNVPVWLQVRVWNAGIGATGVPSLTFEEAVQQGKSWGASDIFRYVQDRTDPPDPSDFYMLEFRGFQLVPEPSTWALLALGAGIVFWKAGRRRFR